MLYAENIGLRDCSGFLQIGSHIYIYIYAHYDEAIHQRNSKVYIYPYTPARGLVCIIYTSCVLCSPEERFNSTNNEPISSDFYRGTKFSAKMIFHIVHLSICAPSNKKSILWYSKTDFLFCTVTIAFRCEGLKFELITHVTLHGCRRLPQNTAKSLGREIQWVLNIVTCFLL